MVASLGAATGLACTRQNPAFDDSDGMTGPGTTVAPPTGEPSTTATPTTSTGSTDASTTGTTASSGVVDPTTTATATTSDISGTSTGGPACAKIGESCGECCGCGVCTMGTCMPDDSLCGPCGECQDAVCVPVPGGKGCTPRGPDTCSDKLWGLMDGDCYAYGPPLGTCDGQAECHAQACGVQGEKLVDCDATCIKDPGECQAGQPAEFDAMQLCEFAGQTDLCTTHCVMNINGDFTYVSSCHAGLCQEDQKLPCGNYRCRDDLKACQTSCLDNADCLFSKICIAGKCTP